MNFASIIKKRFSAAAKTYDRHASPQYSLARSVCDAIPEIYPEEILELGCGTGQLTRLLIDQFPNVPIDAVDLSEKMVAHSRQTFTQFPQVNWIQGDAQTWRGKDLYPLIVSSSALHWVSNLRKTFENIFQCLEKDGVFVLGMMLQGTLKELHAVREEVAPEKKQSFTLPTLENVEKNLQAAGFKILQKEQREEETLYKSATDFLRAIHEQGVTGIKATTNHSPLNRREISQLIETYQTRYATPAGVTATYETATLLLTK